MNSSHILAGASFEAARNLAGIGEHGHSFRVLARADAHPGSGMALHAELAAAVAPFHYAHVNATLADGSDLSIARYLASQCGQAVSLQLASAADRGVRGAPAERIGLFRASRILARVHKPDATRPVPEVQSVALTVCRDRGLLGKSR